MKLSILMPVYNERYLVRQCLKRVLEAPLPGELERELVVVDDGSTDGTGEILRREAAAHPEILLLLHERNRGKGSAVRTAVAAATGDIFLIQDADLEYDPADYPALLGPILAGQADAVFGSRFQGGGKRRVLLFWHSVANRILTAASNIFTDLNLTDVWTCYKAVLAPFMKDMPLRCDGFCIEPELTAKLAKLKCRIYEVPISYSGRTYDEGKKIGLWDAVSSLGVMLGFWLIDDLYSGDHALRNGLGRLDRTTRFNGWLADKVRGSLGARVLEIGAGLGELSAKVCQRDAYIASDGDELNCRHLRRRFANRPAVSVLKIDLARPADLAALPHPVDTVVCMNALERAEDDLAALRGLRGALDAEGTLLLLVPHLPWAYGTLDREAGHLRRYRKESLAALLAQAGFADVEIRDFNRVSLPAWLWNGKVLKRGDFGILQLKTFDSLVWLFERIDRFLPWPGLSLLAVAKRG